MRFYFLKFKVAFNDDNICLLKVNSEEEEEEGEKIDLEMFVNCSKKKSLRSVQIN